MTTRPVFGKRTTPPGMPVEARAVAATPAAPDAPSDSYAVNALGIIAPEIPAAVEAAPPPPLHTWDAATSREAGLQTQFASANGPLLAFDDVPVAAYRPTQKDMYHDVGMYRSKGDDAVVDDTARILSSGRITGMSQKGAQVSANAGPTNWFGSAVTIRVKREPDPTLIPDNNCPKYANWYGTFARGVGIPVGQHEAEVIVNGDSAEEIAHRQAQIEQKLAAEGISGVPVISIDRFIDTRVGELAQQLPEESREGFVSSMQVSPLWTRKAVGEMAADMGDVEFARWREEDVPKIYGAAMDEIRSKYARAGKPALGEDIAQRFFADADRLTEGEQLELARRITKPYTFAVAQVMDGYETRGNGIYNALPERNATSDQL